MQTGFNNTEWILFIAGSFTFLFVTWKISLREKRYHGISRFFSFECILLLILIQWSNWFHHPFSWNQLLSWMFLLLSIVTATTGFYLLLVKGKPKQGLENTTRLVTRGIYRHIRHPLYLSLILLGTGIGFKTVEPFPLLLAAANLVFMYMTARVEEQELKKKFGKEYEDYIGQTGMFLPRI